MGTIDLVQDLAIVLIVATVAGFFCQRIGLSSIVGFLIAGFVVGPHSLPFSHVSNEQEVQALSQLGLVFLMFSIGMELSVGKMRHLGAGIIFAVMLSSVLVFNLVQSVTLLSGAARGEALFVAGMMIASSSAIIGKTLHDSGLIHERAGHLAMSVTVLEDVVAVVVLTLISSVAQMRAGPQADLLRTVSVLLAFIAVVLVLGLLLLPRTLRGVNHMGVDLLTISVAGLALGTGVVAVHTGYSLTLGAFLCGAIIAETPQRPLVERALQGMRDVFIAVFFVAIGMLVSPVLLLKNWGLIVGLGILAISVRAFSTSFALGLTGTPNRDAIRAGLMLTPVGEFTFVIAQVGILSGSLSNNYYTVSVGVALFTALCSPLLVRNSGNLADRLMELQPKFWRDLLDAYQEFLASLLESHRRSQVLTLAKSKLVPVSISLAFASGVLVLAPALFALLTKSFATPPREAVKDIFWGVIGFGVTIPLVAVWRSIVDFLRALLEMGLSGAGRHWSRLLGTGLEITTALILVAWLWWLKPTSVAAVWFFGALFVSAFLFWLIFKKRFVDLHREIGTELSDAILSAEERRTLSHQAWLREHHEWDLHLTELEIPHSSALFGKSLGELALRSKFGCFAVGVVRQGYPIANLGPDTALFPSDTVLLLGTREQAQKVRRYFDTVEIDENKADILDEIRLESIEVAAGSRLVDQSLGELEIPRHSGVQIAGVARGDYRILLPGPFQTLQAHDWLLVVGTDDQIRHFSNWMHGTTPS
ncbi:MAG: cation:proton antiporter [Chthoniobacterales bacterium]